MTCREGLEKHDRRHGAGDLRAIAPHRTAYQRQTVRQAVSAGLGAGFIAAALANRAPGLTVPGGILSGVGLGSLAMNAFRRGFTGPARGGAFLICLALGWLIIVPTSRAAGESYSWAYVPAVILAAVGIALLLTALAPSVVAAALKWWPSVLILAGILMLLRRDTN